MELSKLFLYLNLQIEEYEIVYSVVLSESLILCDVFFRYTGDNLLKLFAYKFLIFLVNMERVQVLVTFQIFLTL